MSNFIKLLQKRYEEGKPLVSDKEYDYIVNTLALNEDSIGQAGSINKNKHLYPMYSLQKVFDEDPSPLPDNSIIVESPKLDGAAISLYFYNGILRKATKRGDGEEGDDCYMQVVFNEICPTSIPYEGELQITGEVVLPKNVPNARNNASGSLSRKDPCIVKDLNFIAYGLQPYYSEVDSNFVDTFTGDMTILHSWGFNTVLTSNDLEQYPQDGKVHRVDSNKLYNELGFTSKYPKGAYARKFSCDVETKETILRDVKWQVGKNGKVTPVAIFDEIIIDDAKINRATLHNAGFIEELDLSIGDTLLITRSGGIIPKVLGKI